MNSRLAALLFIMIMPVLSCSRTGNHASTSSTERMIKVEWNGPSDGRMLQLIIVSPSHAVPPAAPNVITTTVKNDLIDELIIQLNKYRLGGVTNINKSETINYYGFAIKHYENGRFSHEMMSKEKAGVLYRFLAFANDLESQRIEQLKDAWSSGLQGKWE
jgi:hypothetical protein